MSEILGNSATAARVDAAFNTAGEWDRTPPTGFSITCKGLSTQGNAAKSVGVIFELKLPQGYALDLTAGKTGSLHDRNLGTGARIMRFVALSFGDPASTKLWEIWFSEDDVNGDGWGVPIQLQVPSGGSTTTYTYTFRKGGAGGGD